VGSPTTNYSWTKPTVGSDSNTWGTELNSSLDGIDSTVHSVSVTATAALPSASYTAADVLAKMLTVDGSGSGLDADKLDGQDSSFYTNAANISTGTLALSQLASQVFRNVSAGQTSGRVTVSTAAPSGGTSGDIWLQY
jgi:hypothetical protein